MSFENAKDELKEKSKYYEKIIYDKMNYVTSDINEADVKYCSEVNIDIQSLLKHLENLERMKELCRHGYFTTEKGKNAYCVDYIDGINEVKHFTGETFEQALSEAVKSLEEVKK